MIMSASSEYTPAHRLDGFEDTTVWHEFTGLAIKCKSMNLGQGFPDFKPPTFIKEALFEAYENNNLNAYARSGGYLPLCKTLANKYSTALNRVISAEEEVLITVGSTEGLFLAINSLLNPGDEVVCFEPAFDLYHADVKISGGIVVGVPLNVCNNSWCFDKLVFEKSFNERTRLLIINTPHNPTGKQFSLEEMEFISQIVRMYPRVNVITDEVYEHLIYNGPHISFASVSDMYERTLTLASAGKTWSVTGWKIGWCVGPRHLIKAVSLLHCWTSFSVATPMQAAVDKALQFSLASTYFVDLKNEYLARREKLFTALKSVGLIPIMPEGSFFIMADTSNVNIPADYLSNNTPRDYAFCRWLTEVIGVTAIPPSAFMSLKNKPLMHNYARFAFCKSDEVMNEAINRLEQVKKYIIKHYAVVFCCDFWILC